jgi:hypothetical protein
MARKKLSVYQRIMRNAKAKRGITLTANEVWALSKDDAISTVAANDDADDAAGRERGSDPEGY